MGLNLSKAVKAGVGIVSPVNGAIMGAAGQGGIFDFLGPKSNTVTQGPMETPEQHAARVALLGYGNSGNFNGVHAGDAYGGSLGDFNVTPTEQAAQGKLSTFMNSGVPSIYGQGANFLSDFISTDKYNPLNDTNAYKDEAQRNIDLGTADLKSKAAFGRNLYSTGTIKNIGGVEAAGRIALNSKLADLYQNYVGQKLGAANNAPAFAQAGQQLELNPIQAGFQFGGLNRDLANQSAQAKLSEYVRQRQEALQPLSALGAVSGASVPFGVPSVTTQTPSPWMDLLKTLVQGGAAYAGAHA